MSGNLGRIEMDEKKLRAIKTLLNQREKIDRKLSWLI